MPPSPAEQLPVTSESRAGLFVALGFLCLYSILHAVYCGVTIHSIDQIRDATIAADLAAGKAYPASSPPFTGTYVMPPAFYYLLALPLLGGSLEVLFAFFALLYIAALWFAWSGVHARFGPIAGAFFAAICSPFWISLFTHSSWNAGLTYPLSAIVLGCVLHAMTGRRGFWAGTIIAYALLVQIHPSALPLAPGLALAIVLRRRDALNRWTVGLFALALVYFAIWLVPGRGAATEGHAPSFTAVIAQLAGHVANGQKWLDAAILPYRLAEGFSPPPRLVPHLLLALSILVVTGAALSLRALRSMRDIRILWLLVAIWLLAAMGFLATGAWWYLDAIYPWLYCLSAFGWSTLFVARRAAATLVFLGTAVVMFVLSAMPQLWLYRHLDQQGEVFVRVSALTFPQNASHDVFLPLISARTQAAYYDHLSAAGICAGRLAGVNELVYRDYNLRRWLRDCSPGVLQQTAGRQFFFTSAELEEGFFLTQTLTPVWKQGTQTLYAIDGAIPVINGVPRNMLNGEEMLNYAHFKPAALPGGLSVEVATSTPALLRIALRCIEEPGAAPVTWRVARGESADAIRQSSRKIYIFHFHDFEMALRPAPGAASVAVEAEHLPQYCDVSAIARPN